jgi:hypothetical protein
MAAKLTPGPRRFDGQLLDIASASELLGCLEKTLRARISRRLVPFRRFGTRIVFLRTELLAFCEQLDGCRPDEARENARVRLAG